MPKLFDRVTIAGVGLIGGSLALAARAAGLIGEVVGYGRTEANLQTALRRGIIDRYSLEPLDAARDADLLLLAVPVRACGTVARACAPALRADAVVSDVASVKQSVMQDVEAALPAGLSFVGAHPIAGTEESGAAAAVAQLFHASRCVLTPGPHTNPAALAKIRALWEGVGMHVEEMDAARHDEIVAWTSHLPHVVAFSAAAAVADTDEAMALLSGPSFRDLTRVAASSPEMWTDIFLANAAHIGRSVGAYAATLTELRRAISAGDAAAVTKLLERARDARRRWTARAAGGVG